MEATFDFAVSPREEASVYEALWKIVQAPSVKKISSLIGKGDPTDILTRADAHLDLIEKSELSVEIDNIRHKLVDSYLEEVGIIVPSLSLYPESLIQLDNHPNLIYYKGNSSLLFRDKIVSIVGTRNASEDALRKAGYISHKLAKMGVVIVSGLARGIDTAAHSAAIEANGDTIAVLGTPITKSYPAENKGLQELIGKHHLLISHVPKFAYDNFGPGLIKSFFPERNRVMAAISEATIIVEASETSGTRTQARECVRLKKKLIFLSNMLKPGGPTWPHKYIESGEAQVASNITELAAILGYD